jgi:hypothetical protein
MIHKKSVNRINIIHPSVRTRVSRVVFTHLQDRICRREHRRPTTHERKLVQSACARTSAWLRLSEWKRNNETGIANCRCLRYSGSASVVRKWQRNSSIPFLPVPLPRSKIEFDGDLSQNAVMTRGWSTAKLRLRCKGSRLSEVETVCFECRTMAGCVPVLSAHVSRRTFPNILSDQSIYIETSVHNKCRCSFYCALLTLHVSAPIGGHLQVVCNTQKFECSYCMSTDPLFQYVNM